MSNIPEDEKSALLVALQFLRIQLAHENLRQIYGDETAKSLLKVFTNQMVKETLEHFEKITEAMVAMPPGTPMDFMLLYRVMAICGLEAQSEEDFEKIRPFLNMGAEWLNQERVGFQCYLRFTLRYMSDPMPQTQSAADEAMTAFLAETYRRKGARVTLAEKTTYFEDWIGTEE